MATWQEIGKENSRAGRDLYESGHYRSATSRFYYAVFSVVTHELLQRGAASDFTGGRGTPGHAQLRRLVETYFTQLGGDKLDNLLRLLATLYGDPIAADYSLQRIDKNAAAITFRAAEKVFRYLGVKHERK